ncbi:hypothetical protein N3Z16_03525 [Candidatus Megaera polyxenophila]|uniref:hypothetical protein n=1 Tax=Candidatus Megaera polyxenophila TaxID=988779 RepID=UPI00249F72FE|nr:hypothetical protein N3Z16_03525 [Candidatus Megaera polyxenophila]
MQTSRYLDNHDVVPIKDPNFELKDFLLKVYEDSQSKGTVQSWKDKVIGGKSEKLNVLLDFCKDGPWQNKTKEEVLTDAITVAGTSRTSGMVTADTKTVKALVGALNDAFTPETVRLDFARTLGIDMQKDKRFDPSKTFSQNMAEFKSLLGIFPAACGVRCGDEQIYTQESQCYCFTVSPGISSKISPSGV